MNPEYPEPSPWTEPFELPAHMDVADAVHAIIADRWPDVRFVAFLHGVYQIPHLVFGGGVLLVNDPWNDAFDVAWATGHELTFDATTRTATMLTAAVTATW